MAEDNAAEKRDDEEKTGKVIRIPNYNGKQKEQPKKKNDKHVEKVIKGAPVERKKTLGRKLAETFTGDDMHSVGEYILFEVVVPQVKDLLFDSLSQGIQRKLFGGSSTQSYRRPSGVRNVTSYNTMYKSPNPAGRASEPDGPRAVPASARATGDFREIVLETRGDADVVLESLQALIDQYQMAAVSDLYELVGMSSNFTDEAWGWFDLRGAGIQRVREGYLLNMPRPRPLDG